MDRSQRLCTHCDLGKIEDVHHCLVICPAWFALRSKVMELFKQLWPNWNKWDLKEQGEKLLFFMLGGNSQDLGLGCVNCVYKWIGWTFCVRKFLREVMAKKKEKQK